ncbi:hypothetical protein, variant [Verruconis gallopava]|nr:hypothetical protein, variant [Verruconis gallopava]KIW03215.1 hypothetical protein, variant [Verruconis gallopava]
MHKCDNRTPLAITNKDRWINKERVRLARSFDIPMCDAVPDGFPMNTLATQRALTALNMQMPERFPDALAAFYHALWCDRQPIHKPEVAIPILARTLQMSDVEAKALFERGSEPEVKSLLTKNTELAFEEGAFGLPWFVATNSDGEKDSFWGFDRIGQVVDHLGLGRPNDKRGWQAML